MRGGARPNTGGKRPGAGRKKAEVRVQTAHFAERIFANLGGEEKCWTELAQSKDESIRFRAYKFLSEQLHGLPAQRLQVDTKTPIRINLGFVNGHNGTGS